MDEYLIGVRLRPTAQADDYRVGDLALHVGDLVLVETANETVIGEIRRPRREIPEAKKDRAYPRVLRLATDEEARAYRERRVREERAIETCQRVARSRGLVMKVVDVEMHPVARRTTVYFNAEERIDFRDLVRDLARELRSRVEMRQIGARDTTKVLDGIGPCGRQLCCTSHLRRFDPISVKMAKAQDMPLTDNRLLGNCGRLKCCLLYEFSTYDQLRKHLPKVGSACQADCGAQGCMTGKVRSLRVLKRRLMTDATREVLERLQVSVPDFDSLVGLMSGGQRQAVAVSRAAAFASKVVILDEPTAALGVRESRKVLDLILRLRDENRAVVVVSHAMDHVMEVSDRAVVLRGGRKVGEVVPSAETYKQIVSLIVGGGV